MWPRVLVSAVLVAACNSPVPGRDTSLIRPQPDEAPKMVNSELPFHYPGALYALKRQGNVTLRLFVDTTGRTVPESTRVEERSGYAQFDSAAAEGAKALRFIPAKLHGEPVGMTILFPVYFRHPEAPPLVGDTALKKSGRG
jgi:TonB family protein